MMKIKKTITFNWWRSDGSKENVDKDHREYLEDSAIYRINSQVAAGLTSGELYADVDDIEYQGWYEIDSEVIE